MDFNPSDPYYGYEEFFADDEPVDESLHVFRSLLSLFMVLITLLFYVLPLIPKDEPAFQDKFITGNGDYIFQTEGTKDSFKIQFDLHNGDLNYSPEISYDKFIDCEIFTDNSYIYAPNSAILVSCYAGGDDVNYTLIRINKGKANVVPRTKDGLLSHEVRTINAGMEALIYYDTKTETAGFVRFEQDGSNPQPGHGLYARTIGFGNVVIAPDLLEAYRLKPNVSGTTWSKAYINFSPFETEGEADPTLLPRDFDPVLMNCWIDYSNPVNWGTEGESEEAEPNVSETASKAAEPDVSDTMSAAAEPKETEPIEPEPAFTFSFSMPKIPEEEPAVASGQEPVILNIPTDFDTLPEDDGEDIPPLFLEDILAQNLEDNKESKTEGESEPEITVYLPPLGETNFSFLDEMPQLAEGIEGYESKPASEPVPESFADEKEPEDTFAEDNLFAEFAENSSATEPAEIAKDYEPAETSGISEDYEPTETSDIYEDYEPAETVTSPVEPEMPELPTVLTEWITPAPARPEYDYERPAPKPSVHANPVKRSTNLRDENGMHVYDEIRIDDDMRTLSFKQPVKVNRLVLYENYPDAVVKISGTIMVSSHKDIILVDIYGKKHHPRFRQGAIIPEPNFFKLSKTGEIRLL